MGGVCCWVTGREKRVPLCVYVCVYSHWFRILYYHAVKELLGPGTAVQMKVKSHSVSHRCMEAHTHTHTETVQV